MASRLSFIVLMVVKTTLSDKPELPICPTNLLQFFPQGLPMHCRMPTGGGSVIPPIYQPSDKVPAPIPAPIPAPFPPGLPGPVPMPVPPMGPNGKLPVIVMPFYSPDPTYEKQMKSKPGHRHKRRKHYSSHTDTDSDTDSNTNTDIDTSNTSRDTSGTSSDGYWRSKMTRSGRRLNRKHRNKNRRKSRVNKKKSPSPNNVLTPVLQYVTKDGYVIYEKKISRDEAKDWLSVSKKTNVNENPQPKIPQVSKEDKRNDDRNRNDSDDGDDGDDDEVGEVITHKSVAKDEHRKDIRTQQKKDKKHQSNNHITNTFKKKNTARHNT